LVAIGRKCQDTPARWPKNVHVFHDWPHAAVMQAWSRSMLGVAPSIWPEACATVLMEGMASGKPMIASNAGGNPEIVEGNVSGLMVRPGDQRDLAHAIQALAANESLRARLGAGALRKVKAFTASNVVPRIEAVYREVLAGKQHASATVDPANLESVSADGIRLDHDLELHEALGSDAR
jgi:glycosyltransferase involved in cell wall biosynthesis